MSGRGIESVRWRRAEEKARDAYERARIHDAEQPEPKFRPEWDDLTAEARQAMVGVVLATDARLGGAR